MEIDIKGLSDTIAVTIICIQHIDMWSERNEHEDGGEFQVELGLRPVYLLTTRAKSVIVEIVHSKRMQQVYGL